MPSVTIGKRGGAAGATKGHADKNRSSDEAIMKALSAQNKQLIANFNALLLHFDGSGEFALETYVEIYGVDSCTIND